MIVFKPIEWLKKFLSMTYFVPEYHPKNRYYFAGNAFYLSENPVPVAGFDLWVSIAALDTATAPATVVATESRGSTAFMYPVSFEDAQSSLSDIFEISQITGQDVFYLPYDRFLLATSSQPFVQVPNNDWSSCAARFRVLAAFTRLSVTALSPAIFTTPELFDDLCKTFCETYEVTPPVETALASIFSEIVFAFDLFGFARPSTLAETNSIEAAIAIVNDGGRPPQPTFAFGDVAFAITKFNAVAFPNVPPTDRIRPESYRHLRNLVEFVRSALSSLSLIPDDLPPRSALCEGIVRFQRMHDIPTGPCDPFTLRHIWNAAMPAGCDLAALCRLSGVALPALDLPVFTKTLERIELSDQKERLQPVQEVIAHIMCDVLSHAEAADWLVRQAVHSVESQIERLDDAARAARAIDDQVTEIEQGLDETARQGDAASAKFSETAQVLEDVLGEHRVMLREFAVIQKRVKEDQDGNNILLAFVIALAVLAVVNLFK
jgi:hypothetical protein